MSSIKQQDKQVSMQKFTPVVTCAVEKCLMNRIYFALETGRDNANEVYNNHVNCLGDKPTTSRDKHLRMLFKKDFDEVDSLVKELCSKWKFGV